jgi:protein-tyrosine phosphatase
MLKRILWTLLAVAVISAGAIILYPSAQVVLPVEVPYEQREAHRHLPFEGVANARDLGGYATTDGRKVRWGLLYRTGELSGATRRDRGDLERLGLNRLIDFRSQLERDEAPDNLPDPTPFDVISIPVLDDGNAAMVAQLATRINNSNFEGFDPDQFMVEANRQFVRNFTPQFAGFMINVLEAGGKPVLWHCTAGKDRAGFASAILLRTLDVPEEVIMADYMLSRQYSLAAHETDLLLLKLFKSDEAADVVRQLMGVEEHWLQTAFDTIEEDYGSFERYLLVGLGLGDEDIAQLRAQLLE